MRSPGGAPPGIAFLGCGRAADMHSRTLRKIGGVRLFHASREPARAEEAARRSGGTPLPSYEAALERKDVDVVFVTTPPALHLEWALRALDARRHVIVEKPPFLRAADVDRVARTAETAGRRVLVAENYFYKPLARELRRLLAEEAVGRPLFLHVNAVKRQEGGGWRSDPGMAGGGALFEGGIHWIDLMAHLGLDVRGVRGYDPGGDGRSALVVFEYEGGAVGTLSYSWDVPSLPGGPRISRIFGTEGSIFFESNGLFLGSAGRRWSLGVPGLRDLRGFRAMLEDFLKALREDRPPQFTLAMARRDLELVEEALANRKEDVGWNG